jgi:hypothetical protein
MKGTQVKEFSRYVHEIKGMVGKGGADNFKSYQSIKTLGEEFLGLYGK